MLSKSRIQLIKSLHQRKYRNKHQLFIAEGPKLIAELLKSGWHFELILATEKWFQENDRMEVNEKIIEISEQELLRISALKTPNQVLAVVGIGQTQSITIKPNGLTLVLDEIKDPGNLGTIIRTADWFGVDRVICSPDCADIYNPKVVQATMGSVFRVSVQYTDLNRFFEILAKDIPVFGTLLEGSNIYKMPYFGEGIIVIGNESHGISKNLLPFITHKIKIPDYSKGKQFHAESLNASIATAIVLAEFRRQQMA
jgi:TrmH family RNA methyltransferase